jgi:hypothetical protein
VHKVTRVAAICLLCFLFASNFYRGLTQSIAHDEALTYQLYLTGPASGIFNDYHPNNHFLSTLLMRFSTGVLGFSEFSMRLPSLAAGALYFFTVYRLCLLVFGGGLLLVISVTLLSANPLLLDFLIAARGYGLALACFFYALHCLLVYITKSGGRRRLLYHAAAGLSCAVMAHLTLLFPAFVLAVLFLATFPAPAPPRKEAKRRSQRRSSTLPWRYSEAKYFVVPILVLAFAFWVAAPIGKVKSTRLYRPVASSGASFQNLVDASFAHNDGLGKINWPTSPLQIWRKFLALVLLPAVVLIGLLVSLRAKQRSPAGLTLLWASGTVVGSLVLHLVTNFALNWPYPGDRTGLYLMPLVALTLVALLGVVRRRPDRWRLAAGPLAALTALLTAHYVVQFNWNRFYVWPYDADNKRILEKLETGHAGAQAPLSVGISWQLEPSFNFYREARKLKWLPAFDRSGPRGNFDYYVLISQDRSVTKEWGLKTIYEGPVSGTRLATRSP